MYEGYEPWDESIPADLVSAVRHLHETFQDAHIKFGFATRSLCYSQLHKNEVGEDFHESATPFRQLKAKVGLDASERFTETFALGTPSAILKSFWNFYIEGVTLESLRILRTLVQIGRAHESRLGTPHLEWAESQTMKMIYSCDHEIHYWLLKACDNQPFDRTEEWLAPRFLDPSGVYDAATAWERTDSKTTERLCGLFRTSYRVRLDVKVKQLLGEIAVELAMQPTPSTVASQPGKAIRILPSNVSETREEQPAGSAAEVESLRKRIAMNKNGTLRTSEAALLLGVSTKTINRRIQDRILVAGAKRGTVTNASLRNSLPNSNDLN